MQPKKVIKIISTPFQEFINLEAGSGLLLLFTTLVALAWANSPWSESYFALWETPVTFEVGDRRVSETLGHWINDGLMALFFFLVGLEIKREVMVGELSTLRKASLPMLAALGGMAAPVAIFFLINAGRPGADGWGIPMATDIAFSLGVLSLLGSRINLGMKVFLTAFAIVDDIGAVLVIAFFYSGDLAWHDLGWAGVFLTSLLLFNLLGVKNLWMYILAALAMWYNFLHSGLHPTIAGVLAAFAIPARQRLAVPAFIENVRRRITVLGRPEEQGPPRHLLPEEEVLAIRDIKQDARRVLSPLQRLETSLDGFAVYFVIPVFALANAGVSIIGSEGPLLSRLSLSIALGLIAGKTIGIFAFSWLGIRLGLADLPMDTGWRQLLGLSMLGGIGFTMSLFIANLAYEPGGFIDDAKMGILIGSLIAGVGGYLILRELKRA